MNKVTSLEGQGLTLEALTATIGYSLLGILIMVVALTVINKVFRLNMHKELVDDHNIAFGVSIAGFAIAIAIIIAGTILS